MRLLSKRLSIIADFVEEEAAVCDIGTDHGYLAIHLIESCKANRVIAVDINQRPLENARRNIEKFKVHGIELRCCDGFSGIEKNEADTFIIAGMGGEVIAGIIKRGADIAKDGNIRLILQPTTSPEALRRFLYDSGYEILKETAVTENGKIYSVMLVSYSAIPQKMPNYFYYTGRVDACCYDGFMYIKKQYKRCAECMASLESIPHKRQEYLYYKSVCRGIEKIIKETDGEK